MPLGRRNRKKEREVNETRTEEQLEYDSRRESWIENYVLKPTQQRGLHFHRLMGDDYDDYGNGCDELIRNTSILYLGYLYGTKLQLVY